MSRTSEVHCDKCGADITYTSNSVDYRVVLGSEGKSPWYQKEGLSGGVMTEVMIYDPFPQLRHFCNEVCLAIWVRDQYPNAEAAWDRQVKHRAWLESTRANPAPPIDESGRKALAAK